MRFKSDLFGGKISSITWPFLNDYVLPEICLLKNGVLLDGF